MKKIVFICMALVLALGALGVGYAAWYDTVTITGKVSTGSLDLEVQRVDGDRIWKDLDTDSLVYDHWIYDYTIPGYTDPIEPPANALYVAGTFASADVANDTVSWTFDNLFPFTDGGPWLGTTGGGLVASAYICYTGTIPAKLWVSGVISANIAPYAEVAAIVYDADGVRVGVFTLDELQSLQVHNGWCISFYVVITIPQDNDLMGLSGGMDFSFMAMQWNETPP